MLQYGHLKPMEPRLREEPFHSDKHLFQIKWDGVRILAFIENGQVSLQNRKLQPRTRIYPDFQNLHQFIKAREAVLDGEMIVLANNKPSFAGILKRDLKKDETAISISAYQNPATYIPFDLLRLDGQDLLKEPVERRLGILREIIIPHDHLQAIEDFPDGIALFNAIEAQGMEGIVAKEKGSPYLPGEKSPYWLKIKTHKDLIAVVGGFTIKECRLNSLLIGAYLLDQFRYIGNAATGLTSADLQLLDTHLRTMTSAHPPFINPPKIYGVETHWVKPVLTLKLQFLEWTGDYQMRAPVILGFTKDVPEECQIT